MPRSPRQLIGAGTLSLALLATSAAYRHGAVLTSLGSLRAAGAILGLVAGILAQLGMHGPEAKLILAAARVHDIGKIGLMREYSLSGVKSIPLRDRRGSPFTICWLPYGRRSHGL